LCQQKREMIPQLINDVPRGTIKTIKMKVQFSQKKVTKRCNGGSTKYFKVETVFFHLCWGYIKIQMPVDEFKDFCDWFKKDEIYKIDQPYNDDPKSVYFSIPSAFVSIVSDHG